MYTDLLWFFEGLTSYYDSLILRRCHLIDNDDYAKLLSDDLRYVMGNHAHLMQSLSQASFDAWIKFYRPNENSVNAHVSYYRQGALVALMLDTTIRQKTRGKKSLDDVMRLLWEDYKASKRHYSGISSDDLAEIFLRATGIDLTAQIVQWTQNLLEIDYTTILKPLGVSIVETELPCERKLLGITGAGSEAGFIVKSVHEHEAAQWIGISPGDTIIAIDGVRVKNNNIGDILQRYSEGDEMLIHAFRDDSLLAWQMLLGKEKTLLSTIQLQKLTTLGKTWLDPVKEDSPTLATEQ